MDPALKKRLIGASVLIVLAIIFLPMLFDGGGEPSPGDVATLDIPAQPQRDFETRVVPLDLPPAGGVADAIGVAPGTGAAPAGADTSLPIAAPLVDEPVAQVAAPLVPRVDAVSGESVVGGAAEASATASPPAAVAAPLTPPAATSTSPVPSPAPAVDAGGRYLVNIGSYANAGNAAELEGKLRAAGLAVRSESLRVDGKAVQRLRLGPYASRALAESARLKARAVRADIPASVIEIDDTPSSDVPARPAQASAGGYAVQVAVLSDAAKVEQRRDELRKAGFAAFVEKLQTDKGTVYRLRVGPEAERVDAEKIKSALKQRFGQDAIIVDYR